MPEVTINYYGMTGRGKNVTEAKRNASEQIEKALQGDYVPSIIRWRGYIVLVAREPHFGWGYRISHPEEKGREIRERIWINSCSADQDECLLAVARHIGDIGRPYDEDPELTRPLFEALCRPFCGSAERDFESWKKDMRRNYTFQARYKHAVQMGMTDNDPHAFACMYPTQPELWRGTESLFLTPPWEQAA